MRTVGMAHLPATKPIERTTSIDTLATRSLGLPLTNQLELDLAQPDRIMRALHPDRDRSPLLERLGVIEHDGALYDTAGVHTHEARVAQCGHASIPSDSGPSK